MIKLGPAITERDQLFSIAKYVDAHAGHILEQPTETVAASDVEMLRRMRDGIGDDLGELDRLFALTLTSAAREAACQLVGKLMIRAHGIGVAAVHSPEAEQWRGAVRAFKMRSKRSQKPNRKAVLNAIEAEHGAGPVAHPFKEAGAILSAVNKRLQDDGIEPVDQNAVYRELSKLPRF